MIYNLEEELLITIILDNIKAPKRCFLFYKDSSKYVELIFFTYIYIYVIIKMYSKGGSPNEYIYAVPSWISSIKDLYAKLKKGMY